MNLIMELLFPRRCPVCDRPVRKFRAYICPKCKDELKYVSENSCLKCGKQLSDENAVYCRDCRVLSHSYDKGYTVFDYKSIRRTIYRFKYRGRQEYADFLGQETARKLKRELKALSPDALIPIPLHPAKEKTRGYNQAVLLAQALGRETGIPVLPDFLIRVKNTVPQKELSLRDRQNNLKKAFNIAQNDVKLSTIVIIDDIYTTGATVDAAALVCRQHGIKKIYFISLAAGRGL